MRPCTRPMRTLRQRLGERARRSLRGLRVAAARTPRSAGRPSRPGGPARHASRMRSTTSSRRVSGSATVCTGVRPGGSSSITEHVEIGVGRHRQRARDRRRGHDRAGAGRGPSAAPFSRSAAAGARRSDAARRRSTSASRWNSTPSWNSACVPTTTCASPDGERRRARVARARRLRLPVSSATRDAERLEPAREVARVLLGEQLGRRHHRGLAAVLRPRAAPRARRRRSCRSRRRPAPAASSGCDCARSRAISCEHALLRAASARTAALARSARRSAAAPARAASAGSRWIVAPQQPQAQLVREQLLEREAALRRMPARVEQLRDPRPAAGDAR